MKGLAFFGTVEASFTFEDETIYFPDVVFTAIFFMKDYNIAVISRCVTYLINVSAIYGPILIFLTANSHHFGRKPMK